MSFKENLLKKIEIDTRVEQILKTVGPYDSGLKVDKAAVRQLLDFCGYTHLKKRGMDLFMAPGFSEKGKILVLDNELKVYDTNVEDVVLRKNPLIKEMISIRNVIKILNDKDVVLSKKEETINALQAECTDLIDLTYDASDLDEIIKDGAASLEKEYADGVTECLTLFAELLGYKPPPKAFKIAHHTIFGQINAKAANEIEYGPIIIYNLIHNKLVIQKNPISSLDTVKIEFVQRMAAGKEKTDQEGSAVFQFLKAAVLKKKAS